MLRFTYDGHMYLYAHIYVSDQATMPLVWNLLQWLFLLWVLIYVCSISWSCFMQFSPFGHTIIPHLYIFTPIFIVSPNSLGLMLFGCNWCEKKKFILSYLILYILRCEMKSLIHFQTATVQFGNGWIISSHTLLNTRILIHTGIEDNPYWF